MHISECINIHAASFRELVDTTPWEALSRIEDFCRGHNGIHSQMPEGVFVSGQVYIGSGCIIEPGAYIQGPCIIGDGSEVRHGAYIRGNVVVGRGCVIGHASEIKNSIFFDGAKAPHFNYIGDSILGNNTNMGAGSITANVRFDQKPIRLVYEGNSFDTGRNKFGLVLGDGAQVGCNVVTNPGTVLKKGVHIPQVKVQYDRM